MSPRRTLRSGLKSRSQRRKAHKGVQMNVFEPALYAYAALREQKSGLFRQTLRTLKYFFSARSAPSAVKNHSRSRCTSSGTSSAEAAPFSPMASPANAPASGCS